MRGLFTNRRIVVSVALAVLLLSGLLLTGSQRVLIAPININEWQYTAALVKWNGLHASEYEQTFQDLGCRFKMVVSIERTGGNPVETVTQYESLGSTSSDDNSYCKGYLNAKDDTVAGLFQFVDYVLTHPTESATNPYHGFPEFYSVTFNSTMGYPSSFEIYGGGYPIRILIENLKVLK
jgi:hypothetical protein